MKRRNGRPIAGEHNCVFSLEDIDSAPVKSSQIDIETIEKQNDQARVAMGRVITLTAENPTHRDEPAPSISYLEEIEHVSTTKEHSSHDDLERIVNRQTQRPPSSLEYMLMFLPKNLREPILGDLEEEYGQIGERFGRWRANLWYAVQIWFSFWPIISAKVTKLSKIGIAAWLGDLVRRKISGG